ncbi:hypothetical protein [Azospirillum argentinense]
MAWNFLWERYATINWAATYVAPFFALQAVLLAVVGVRLRWSLSWSGRRLAGLALFLSALVLHPLAAPLVGRPLRGAEVFGITPDPTAIATIGLAMIAGGRAMGVVVAADPRGVVPRQLGSLAQHGGAGTMGASRGGAACLHPRPAPVRPPVIRGRDPGP